MLNKCLNQYSLWRSLSLSLCAAGGPKKLMGTANKNNHAWRCDIFSVRGEKFSFSKKSKWNTHEEAKEDSIEQQHRAGWAQDINYYMFLFDYTWKWGGCVWNITFSCKHVCVNLGEFYSELKRFSRHKSTSINHIAYGFYFAHNIISLLLLLILKCVLLSHVILISCSRNEWNKETNLFA